MEITEIKVFPRVRGNRKLKAYVTVTFDNAFVVRNIKVIEGNKGLFVAMPSRKVQRPCPRCRRSNPVLSRFCNYCGVVLEGGRYRIPLDRQQATKDIAHPINQDFRTYLEKKVLESYQEEVKKYSQGESQPGSEELSAQG